LTALVDIEFDQTKRLISVEAFHLGPKKILITAFRGVEQLSALSRFQLEIMTIGRALEPSEALGKSLTVALRHKEKVRRFSGIIAQIQAIQTSIREHHLHIAELVPPAWIATLNQRCRIFSEKEAGDVASDVLQECSTTSVAPSTAQREYIVQYCESDFNFASRLLEEEGLFYYFDHEQSNCPMVIGNGSSDYSRTGIGTVEFLHHIDQWEPQYRIGASSFKQADWDFKAVSVMNGNANGLPKLKAGGVADRPVYEYPGRHATTGQAKDLARLRMEEHETELVRVKGINTDIDMKPASKFKIKDHSVSLIAASQKTDSYAVIAVEHDARDGAGIPFEGPSTYRNNFVCIPSDVNFRPPRISNRPLIYGPQTAIVTDGPDEYGRSKVKFHWDEQEQSRWCRVAQNWAYNQMGTQFLPRKDSEVVVEFLDGDPDQPIIVGMVYNGKNKLPYSLPANKTQSGVRGANWDSAGTPDKSNELRFEDKSGSEEIYIHAQKDFRRVVYHDDLLTVDTGNRTLEITQGNVSETLDQGNKSLQVKEGNLDQKLDAGNYSVQLTAGNHSLKLDAGQSTTDAMQSITLKVGGNSITIDQTGISLKGIMIKIEGTAMLNAKSPMTQVNGDGMLTLKGGITMIN
jgi:type VI secretion system secreted protein VgrG